MQSLGAHRAGPGARQSRERRAPGRPPLLASALRYAVFPGGHRIRPQLCLAVARACGDERSRSADAAAAAIELLHCASLVHDDLPCFDDADMRRGKPSVHAQFGEPIAVLAGDALIVLAFETLAREASAERLALPRLASSPRRSARRAASSPARPGNARRPSRSSTISAPRPARCSSARPWPAPPRPASSPSPGGRSARSSARPTRSPTTCATCFATRRNSASRSARTRRAAGRTPPPSSGSAAPRRGSSIWSSGGSAPFPIAPARSELCAVDRGADARSSFPSSSPASRPDATARWPPFRSGLSGRAFVESVSATGAAGSSPTPRFQRWAANSPLTRWIARRRARALFDLCAGFVYSQILQRLRETRGVRASPRRLEGLRSSRAADGLDVPAAAAAAKAAASLAAACAPCRTTASRSTISARR